MFEITPDWGSDLRNMINEIKEITQRIRNTNPDALYLKSFATLLFAIRKIIQKTNEANQTTTIGIARKSVKLLTVFVLSIRTSPNKTAKIELEIKNTFRHKTAAFLDQGVLRLEL